jgi:hypothetical protein
VKRRLTDMSGIDVSLDVHRTAGTAATIRPDSRCRVALVGASPDAYSGAPIGDGPARLWMIPGGFLYAAVPPRGFFNLTVGSNLRREGALSKWQ